jgi:hypothetical protein
MDVQVQTDTDQPPTTLTKSPTLPFHSNPDILDEVCEYLAYDHDSAPEDVFTSKRNLLRLALTCKAFLEPALDRLWRSLDCLFPLLKILPAFAQSDGTYVGFFCKSRMSLILILFLGLEGYRFSRRMDTIRFVRTSNTKVRVHTGSGQSGHCNARLLSSGPASLSASPTLPAVSTLPWCQPERLSHLRDMSFPFAIITDPRIRKHLRRRG